MSSRRSPIVIILALVLVACLCITGIGVLGYSFFAIRGSEVSSATGFPEAVPVNPETTATPPAPPETDFPDPEPTATSAAGEPAEPTGEAPSAGDDLSPEVAAGMDAIQEQVIAIRGLGPAGEFTRAIFSPEDLRERVVNDFFSDYSPEEAADDAMILSLLGLLEPDFDLIALYIELFSEQVAGFYDDETKEMVVVGDEGFRGPEKITYAHEYNHALQDQNFDFEDGLLYNEESCEADTERCAAIQALIEGDSTLLEIQWVQTYATQQDLQEYLEYANSIDLSVFESAPAYLQEDFIFPYDEGYLFVESLFSGGGWDAVDAAYADPPVSTEQILHPEKYPSDAPAPVSLPDLLPVLGDGWELVDDNVMGEWYTYLILAFGADAAARLSDDDAASAAAGWGGDRYVVYIHRETGALALALKATWDTPGDAAEFADAFRDHAGARFGTATAGPSGAALYEGDAGVHLFLEAGGATIWIAAPDPDTAAAMLDAVQQD